MGHFRGTDSFERLIKSSTTRRAIRSAYKTLLVFIGLVALVSCGGGGGSGGGGGGQSPDPVVVDLPIAYI